MPVLEPVDRFFLLFAAGVGLLLVGAANLLGPKLGFRLRLLITGLIGVGVLTGLWVWAGRIDIVGRAAGLLALGVVSCAVLGSLRLASAVAAVARCIRHPSVRWSCLALVGLGTATGSVLVYESEADPLAIEDPRQFGEQGGKPPLAIAERIQATTDRGTAIGLNVPSVTRSRQELTEWERRALEKSRFREALIRRSSVDDTTNCHGWVFTGGQYWLTGEAVEKILEENGYGEVASPRPGDLAIYRDFEVATHTAVVRSAEAGGPVIVEGKWSWMGVFLHPVDQSWYGTNVKYYRTARGTHLLTGLGGPSPGPTVIPADVE